MQLVIDPPQELLREWFSYDPETGIFIWRKEPRPARPLLGREVGCISVFGYRRIGVRGYSQKLAGRLAWIYCNGEISISLEVDHINGNTSDDRLINLRLATSSQQKQNRKCQSNNRAGLRGAYYHARNAGKKWRSQIKVGQKLIFLGYFHTAQEASDAHNAAAKKYFGEFYSNRVTA